MSMTRRLRSTLSGTPGQDGNRGIAGRGRVWTRGTPSLAICISLVAGCLLGGRAADAGTEAWIRGVVYSADGAILADATVEITEVVEVFRTYECVWVGGATIQSTRADESGGFAHPVPADLAPSQFVCVVARAPDHSASARLIEVQNLHGVVAICFALERTGVLEGQAQWENQAPVRNTVICVWPTHCGPRSTLPRMSFNYRSASGPLYVAPTLCGPRGRPEGRIHELGLVHVATTDEAGHVRVPGLGGGTPTA